MAAPRGAESKLFSPLNIGNGKIHLKHRIVFAPLTRNRGVPLYKPTPDNPTRIWIHDELGIEYYRQRANDGGLLISEGIPPSLESNGSPGVPGLWLPEQAAAWKKATDAVHAQGGYIYAQIWHAGRATLPMFTGTPTVSASATPYEGNDEASNIPPGYSHKVKYRDFPPTELSHDGIKRQIDAFVNCAKLAMESAGFDGVEVHGANGYICEQFLNDNVNKRTDEYGGTPEKRCRFVIELMEALARAVGQENLAIRLSPFGLYNQMRGSQRLETWSHLCKELKSRIPRMSYIHFMEPRFEQLIDVNEKQKFLDSWGISDIDLSPFRKIMGGTPFFSAGGWNDQNVWGVLESGKYDAIAIGRYFLSTPDLPQRLRTGKPLNKYDRARFYLQPPNERAIGYVDYPFWSEVEKAQKEVNGTVIA